MTWVWRVQVLLSKGVEEGRILFLTLIAAPEGIHNICQRFPRLKLITSEIDQCVDEAMQQVVPGKCSSLEFACRERTQASFPWL